MTVGRLATEINTATALWTLITTTVAVVDLMAARYVDEDAATTDWGCSAAAAQYQHLGDDDAVPQTLIEGERFLLELKTEIIVKMAATVKLVTLG